MKMENEIYSNIATIIRQAMENAIAPLHAQLNALIEAERKPVEKPEPKPEQEEIPDFKELGERMRIRDSVRHGNVNPVNWEAIAKNQFGKDYKIY